MNAYDSMRNEKEPRAVELALYTSAKKKEKNDSLEGGVRKRRSGGKRVLKEEKKKRKNRSMWGTTNTILRPPTEYAVKPLRS